MKTGLTFLLAILLAVSAIQAQDDETVFEKDGSQQRDSGQQGDGDDGESARVVQAIDVLLQEARNR